MPAIYAATLAGLELKRMQMITEVRVAEHDDDHDDAVRTRLDGACISSPKERDSQVLA
jgi:hypothetical protein